MEKKNHLSVRKEHFGSAAKSDQYKRLKATSKSPIKGRNGLTKDNSSTENK